MLGDTVAIIVVTLIGIALVGLPALAFFYRKRPGHPNKK